jgi:hypothetical protein
VKFSPGLASREPFAHSGVENFEKSLDTVRVIFFIAALLALIVNEC